MSFFFGVFPKIPVGFSTNLASNAGLSTDAPKALSASSQGVFCQFHKTHSHYYYCELNISNNQYSTFGITNK
jgi:hypothetical protein